jgi:hypothetical protein
VTPPAAAAAQTTAPARPLAPGRPRTTSPRPRRVSGPARRARPAAPQQRPQQERGGLALGVLAVSRGLSGHRLLDRLIAGRIWIALVAFALIGIVTLQLLLLTLNGNIGRALEREALLQRENAAMSIEDSELAAGERVEASAARLGMELVPAGALSFLPGAGHGELARALTALEAPLQAAAIGGAEAGTASTGEASSASAEAAGAASPAQGPGTAPAGAPAEADTAPAEAAAPAQAPATTPPPPAGQEPSAASASADAGEATPAGGTQASPAG